MCFDRVSASGDCFFVNKFDEIAGDRLCKPKDAIFIDDVVINLEGAAKMEITPILITRENAPKTKEDFVTIKTLEELIK